MAYKGSYDLDRGNRRYNAYQAAFRGVDFASNATEAADYRLPFAVNMYRDYRSMDGSALETFPGYRALLGGSALPGGEMHGMWIHRHTSTNTSDRGYEDGHIDFLYVHVGSNLYRVRLKTRDTETVPTAVQSVTMSNVAGARDCAAAFGDDLIILDGANIYKCDNDPATSALSVHRINDLSAYAPIAYSDGKFFEQRNLLAPAYAERYNLYDLSPYESNGDFGLKYEIKTVSGTKYADVSGWVVNYQTKGYIPPTLEGLPTRVNDTIAVPSVMTELTIDGAVLTINAEFTGGNFGSGAIIFKNVSNIPANCFYQIDTVGEVFFPKSLSSGSYVGTNAFAGIRSLYYDESIASWISTWLSGSHSNIPIGDAHEVKLLEGSVGDIVEIVGSNIITLRYGDPRTILAEPTPSIDGFFAEIIDNGCAIFTAKNASNVTKNYVLSAKDLSGNPLKNPGYYSVRLPQNDYTKVIGTVFIDKTEIHQSSYPTSGVKYKYKRVDDADGYLVAIHVYAPTMYDLIGKVLTINNNGVSKKYSAIENVSTFLDANTKYTGTLVDAINQCTICTVYDGRLFISGNPKLPNTVFYCGLTRNGVPDVTYWGVFDFFNDGMGSAQVQALLPTGQTLIVFKDAAANEATVYYHVGSQTSDNIVTRIYPRTDGFSSASIVGKMLAYDFLDDPVFLTVDGLKAITKLALNSERSVERRSQNVDPQLVQEDMQNATMTEWEGWLFILCPNGHAYIADSRALFQSPSGDTNYEWFYLDDLGFYAGQTNAYRYAQGDPLPGYYVITSGNETHELKIKPIAGDADLVDPFTTHTATAFSPDGEDTITAHYVIEDGVYYLLDNDGEKTGGTFHPATHVSVRDCVMILGTNDGHLLCLNNDKRGIANTGDTIDPDRIDPKWYTHNDRAYLSAFATAYSDCGVPHLSKSTTRRSVIAKLKRMSGSGLNVKVRTNRHPFAECQTVSANELAYTDYEFDYVNTQIDDDVLIRILEWERNWMQKQFYFYSDRPARPFGVRHIAYRYEVNPRNVRIL